MGRERLPDGSLRGVHSPGWRLTQAYIEAKADNDIEKQKWVMRGVGACVRIVARECGLDARYQKELRRVTARAVKMVGEEGWKRNEGIRVDAVHEGQYEIIRNCMLSAAMMQWAALRENYHGILEIAIEEKLLYAMWLHGTGAKTAQDIEVEDIIKADIGREGMSDQLCKVVDFVLGASDA